MMYQNIWKDLPLNPCLEGGINMLRYAGSEIELVEFNLQNEEIDKYYKWLRNLDNIMFIGRTEYLLSMEKSSILNYIESINASPNDCFFSVYFTQNSERVFIGTLKLGHIDWRSGVADIGILIGDDRYKGIGLSSEILKLGCQYGFDVLGLRKITGGCYSRNKAMIRCFEKNGFVREGELRKQLIFGQEFDDHYIFGLFKDELI